MQVEGRGAVVTGAAGGIGAALALALLERGAAVTVTDLDEDRLEDTRRQLADAHPGRVSARAADATDEASLARVLGAAREAHGPVDLFFANAGVPGGADLRADDAQWQLALDVNVLAHVRAARLLVPEWLERGEGYFVSTASAAGLLTQLGSATYSVSKHAAVSFAEWLSVTYGRRGVRVSCVCPMGVETAMLDSGRRSPDEVERTMARAVTEAGGVLTPAEVADEVLAGVEAERFLVLPHPEVQEMYRRKADDPDRWIAGMQRYAESLS